jgi:hypothetical protein
MNDGISTMATLQKTVSDFLAQRRIAVAGVSRSSDAAANLIYRKLRDAGYTVFAVNPKASTVEGDPCYPDLASLPERPDGLVIATPPNAAPALVQACADLGIPRVWMHRSFGTGSVSDEATALGRQLGLTVIPGACPMMFLDPVDGGHTCIRWLLKWTGGLPDPVVPTSRSLDLSA